MKGKLRKFTQIALLAVILGAALLPSMVLAQGTGTTTTPAATTTAAAAPQTAAPSSQTADAGFLANIVVRGIASLVGTLIELFGKLTIQLIDILVQVAQYNGYMDSPAITTGWVIVRDIANLFFVALILVVSIGSIVNPDKFGGAKQVFRILLFALFVNFSRFIAALCIDISQLVMLTFVNGFAQAAGGNFTEALGVTKLTELAAGGALTPTAAVAGIFMALFMFVVITVIIGVMVVALVVRMVTLWLLVVISPIAFACGASDLTKDHYKKWWALFSGELTTGPIVAFFLWLSLVSLQGTSGSGVTGQVLQGTSGGKTAVNISCGEITACSEENMIRFIVAAVMLMAGLGFAKEFSGVGGTLAKGAASYGSKYADRAMRWTARKAALPVGAYLAPGAAVATGGVALALRSQAVRDLAGKTMAKVPRFIPGVRNTGLRLRANVAKERLENVKKAEETAKFTANWQQTRNNTYTTKRDEDGNVISASERLTIPMETALANYKWLMKDKKFLSEADGAEKQFVIDQAGKYAKELNDKETKDLVTEVEKANPHLIPYDKPASDPAFNKDKDGNPITDARFKEIRKTSSTSDAVKLDIGALKDIKVVASLTPSEIEKLHKDGNMAQWQTLGDTLKKISTGDYKDTGITDKVGEEYTKEYFSKIENNKRGVDSLFTSELEAPASIIAAAKKGPTKDWDDLKKDKDNAKVMNKTAVDELDKMRKSGSFDYKANEGTGERLAEIAAITGKKEDVAKAFNYNSSEGRFDDNKDREAFQNVAHGKHQAEFIFNLDTSDIKSGDGGIGEALARKLEQSDFSSLLKKADGNTAKIDILKHITKTMAEIAATTKDKELSHAIEEKLGILRKASATRDIAPREAPTAPPSP